MEGDRMLNDIPYRFYDDVINHVPGQRRWTSFAEMVDNEYEEMEKEMTPEERLELQIRWNISWVVITGDPGMSYEALDAQLDTVAGDIDNKIGELVRRFAKDASPPQVAQVRDEIFRDFKTDMEKLVSSDNTFNVPEFKAAVGIAIGNVRNIWGGL